MRFGADLPVDVIEENIAHALDLIVQVERCADGSRRVASAAELSFDRDARRCEVSMLFDRDGAGDALRWRRVPEWVGRWACVAGAATEREVGEWADSLLSA